MIEHVTVIDLENGFYRLEPEEGYWLTDGERLYSEAVVKDLKGWKAVKKE